MENKEFIEAVVMDGVEIFSFYGKNDDTIEVSTPDGKVNIPYTKYTGVMLGIIAEKILNKLNTDGKDEA